MRSFTAKEMRKPGKTVKDYGELTGKCRKENFNAEIA